MPEKKKNPNNKSDMDLFTLAFEQSPIGMALVGLKGQWLYVNDAACKMFGYTKQKFYATNFQRLTHPDDLQKDIASFEKILSGELDHYQIEKRYIHSSGEIIYGLLSVSVVRDQDTQKPLFFISQIQDVTEQKKAELAIERQKRFFQLFIQHTPAAVAMLDRDMRYITYSKRWLSDYGVNEKDLENKTHYEVFPEIPEKHPEWVEMHQRCLNGETIITARDEFIRADGKKEYLRYELIPWMDDNENIGGIIMFTEVITAQVKEQETYLQQQKNETMQEVTGGVAHEVNNLLQPVLIFSEMLKDDFAHIDEEIGMLATHILDNTERAAKILRDVLLYSRHNEQKTEIIDLIPELEKNIHFIKTVLPSTIDVEYTKNNDIDAFFAETNRVNLQQIILNITNNAHHAMKGKGAIKISLERVKKDRKNYLALRICDSGPGIPADVITKVFDPFFTTKDIGEGTGLGLSITKSLIESWSGEIEAANNSECGACFTLYFPETKPQA